MTWTAFWKFQGWATTALPPFLSFGYDFPTAVLDTNVERILLRAFRSTLPARPSRILLREVAQVLFPKERHREYNYGLLDLGRLICRYSDPNCGECPLASVCDFAAPNRDDKAKSTEDDSTAPPNRLRAIRRLRGLSLRQLAEAARLSKLTVIRIENGRTSPRRETIRKLAQVLGVSPKKLDG